MENDNMKFIYAISLFGFFLSSNLLASEALYKPCVSCHGSQGEKRALGKSKMIAHLSKEEIVTALEGYKNNLYGGPFKKIMQEHTSSLSQNDIQSLSEYIHSFKRTP